MDSGRPWLGNLASDELFQEGTVDPERTKIFRAVGIHSPLITPLITAGRPICVVLRAEPAHHRPLTATTS